MEERTLTLVSSSAGNSRRAFRAARLAIEPSLTLTGFADAAAAMGLPAAEAVRVCLERALLLRDVSALGIDAHAARQRLRTVAAQARAHRELVPEEAGRVRALRLGRPTSAEDVRDGLSLVLPPRLLTRALTVNAQAFDARVLPEAIAWEVAAALDGRTIAEWALCSLVASRLAS